MCQNKNHELESQFNPKNFEEQLYQNWEESGYFKASEDKSKNPYSIVMPPPNITGKLHMGHALDNTIQDIIIRFKRMKGYNVLWIPGADHAAIATEAKLVAALKELGITKDDLGRDGFLEKAWEWKEEYGGTIRNQLKKLGCSCDWEKERFTMDEGASKAVEKVFIDLYHKGLIYKGKRMINWCPYCNTSISDAEVEYEEEKTHLWHIRYRVTGTEDRYLVVATTRPETMLGDTAIAVHPSDKRYQDLIGKTCILPIMNKEIPIIADEFVEKEFGTGCVKITPAHDPNDYASGQRHNLGVIEVFDENFKMNDLVPEYKGMDIYEARKAIVSKLKEIGTLVKIEDYDHNVGKCYRCHNTIEPKISEQWFVKMEPLAKPAIEVVRNKQIQFVPERFDKIYYNWMENIQDWCISRQLWWGHRIPAYYCEDCGEIMVSEMPPKTCTKCGSSQIYQDEDTLDTWFSSALWPFSTLGWPEETEDYNYFYPTSILVTGYDIIFFWVARMIFSGVEHTGKIPFDHVLIHGIVRDAEGRKMSKSLGNGIDPLEIIDKYGTDSLRLSLIIGNTPGNDIRYTPDKLESASNFGNKLWNASKFVLMQLEDIQEFKEETIEQLDFTKLLYVDKWILSRLNTLIKEVNDNIEKCDLGIAAQKIYDFIRNDFCDWYIEIVKPRLYNKQEANRYELQYVLNYVLTTSLKLLHPFMPYITEEIYSKLYHKSGSIMITNYPEYQELLGFQKEEKQTEQIMKIITEIRNLRSNLNVHPAKKTKLVLVTKNQEDMIKQSIAFLKKLGFSDEIIIQKDKTNIPENAMSILTEDIEVYIPFEQLVDIEAEKIRLQEEIKKLESEVARSSKMLSNHGFVNKAPETKIAEEKEKLAKYEELLQMTQQRLASMDK